MIKHTSVVLISEDPNAHGVFDAHTDTERTVRCTEKSTRQYRTTQASATGIMPDVRLTFERESTYHGEKTARYGGELFEVIDFLPFEKVSGGELLLRRTAGNADNTPQTEDNTPQTEEVTEDV